MAKDGVVVIVADAIVCDVYNVALFDDWNVSSRQLLTNDDGGQCVAAFSFEV